MATTTDLILLQYLDILEKTNQQLGLWSNPYGIMVAVLSFFVAILAIVFAFYLWKQSRDYQKKFDKFLSKLQENFDRDIKKDLKFRSKQNKRFKKMITEKKKEIENLTGSAKEKAEKEVREIQEIKNSLNRKPFSPFFNSVVVSDENLSYSIPTTTVSVVKSTLGQKKCKKCGKHYDANLLSTPTVWTVNSDGSSETKCPHCGNIN